MPPPHSSKDPVWQFSVTFRHISHRPFCIVWIVFTIYTTFLFHGFLFKIYDNNDDIDDDDVKLNCINFLICKCFYYILFVCNWKLGSSIWAPCLLLLLVVVCSQSNRELGNIVKITELFLCWRTKRDLSMYNFILFLFSRCICQFPLMRGREKVAFSGIFPLSFFIGFHKSWEILLSSLCLLNSCMCVRERESAWEKNEGRIVLNILFVWTLHFLGEERKKKGKAVYKALSIRILR